MKLIPAVCICLLMLSVSCKKSNDQPNTPPSATDTAKIPVVKVDTSTLLKSMLGYYYDASGTAIADSSLIVWKYDDQRRIVQMITKAASHIDTFFYTYASDRYITDDHSYNNGLPIGFLHTVYYQHLQNHADSVITNSGNSTYFYYNQLGGDSLERHVIGTSSAYPTIVTINYYYTGQNLDSSAVRINGILSSIDYYTNGNITGSSLYTLDAGNVLETTTKISYTNIPVGGLNVYFNSSTLKSGNTLTNISSGTTSVETDSYKLDAVNRVTLLTINNSQPYYQKYLFSYY